MKPEQNKQPLDRVARKEDVWHLVTRGILMRLHFDLETFGLERDFAQIASYGDALGDIAGNFVSSEEYHVKRPDRYLPSPESLLVTRTSFEELNEEDRETHSQVMGRIAARFENAAGMLSELGLPERKLKYRTVRTQGSDQYTKDYEETVIEYPLKNEDGDVVYDVRYHPEKNWIAYRFSDDPKSEYYDNVENNYYVDEDGSKWRFKSNPRLLVSGYRTNWYDISRLRANLVKAGFHPQNIFFPHSKAAISSKEKPKNFAVDTYPVALNTFVFGPQGEEGLKISDRVDPKTGKKVASATLSRIMKENTRHENKTRGIRGGIRMPDGSLYNEEMAHRSPAYDAQASYVLYDYSRDIAPDIVKGLELQSDEKHFRKHMIGQDNLDHRDPPIHALLRNDYPHAPKADPCIYLGMDDQLGDLRRVLMMRLDFDFSNFSWRDQKLDEMKPDDIALMIKEQQRTPHSLIRLLSFRKWPGATSLSKAMETRAGKHWDPDQIIQNFQYLQEHPEVVYNVKSAVEILNREIRNRSLPANPMMEEEATRNGFGYLDFYENEVKKEQLRNGKRRRKLKKGMVPSFVETLHERATHVFEYHNMVDEALHRLTIQPLPIDFEDTEEAVKNFRDVYKRVLKKFKEKGCRYSNIVKNTSFYKRHNSTNYRQISAEDIREFRWDLRKKLMEDDFRQRNDKTSAYSEGIFDRNAASESRVVFGNLSRDFRVVDEHGHQLKLDYLKDEYARDPNTVINKFEEEEWRIEFYRLSSEPSITATLFKFADEGRLEELDPFWQEHYDALRAEYLYGAANEDPKMKRWPCIPRVRESLKRIEVNDRMRDMFEPRGDISRVFSHAVSGAAEVFAQTDEGQRILGEYKAALERIEKKYPLKPEQVHTAQYDPETGLPYDRIEHVIPSDDFIIVDIPDPMIRNPLRDIRRPPLSVLTEKLNKEQRDAIKKRKPVIFRGEQTGQLFYAGPVNIRKAPSENGSYSDYMDQARRAYEDEAGVPFPDKGNRDVLLIQTPEPVANTRQDIDPSLQSVKVPKLFFDGLVEPRLAHSSLDEPFTGLVLPADYCPQILKTGETIRLREMDAAFGAKLTAENGPSTGHTYESELKTLEKITLGQLERRVTEGTFTDDDARTCGFVGAFDMIEKITRAFLDNESPSLYEEEIYLLRFDPVEKDSWAWFNPKEAPAAAISYNADGTVPPSSYRTPPVANDNAWRESFKQARKRSGNDNSPS